MKDKEAKIGMIVRSNRGYEESNDKYMIGEIVKITSGSVIVKTLDARNSNIKDFTIGKKGKEVTWPADYLDIYEDRRV